LAFTLDRKAAKPVKH